MSRNALAPALAGGVLILAQVMNAATIQQDFTADPTGQGWRVFGDTNLFNWNATQQNLNVTWDSSRANSYFYHGLGTVLSREDDFTVSFDLYLNDIGAGVNTNKPGAFGLSIALINFGEATSATFRRGTGTNSPNLVEFDYFRDAGFGATIWPAVVSSNSVFNYNGPSDFTLLALDNGTSYHVTLTYAASNATMVTTMTQNGTDFGPIDPVPLATNFTDFRVDTFAICSYNDAGDDYDSLLAHGTIDNVAITTPPPPLSAVSGGFTSTNTWQIQFVGRTNWVYTLQRTTDWQNWTSASSAISGTGSGQVLQDNVPTSGPAFYRVQAQRP